MSREDMESEATLSDQLINKGTLTSNPIGTSLQRLTLSKLAYNFKGDSHV